MTLERLEHAPRLLAVGDTRSGGSIVGPYSVPVVVRHILCTVIGLPGDFAQLIHSSGFTVAWLPQTDPNGFELHNLITYIAIGSGETLALQPGSADSLYIISGDVYAQP